MYAGGWNVLRDGLRYGKLKLENVRFRAELAKKQTMDSITLWIMDLNFMMAPFLRSAIFSLLFCIAFG